MAWDGYDGSAPGPVAGPGGDGALVDVFGLVVPGRPVLTEFRAFAPDKAYVDIPEPTTVSEVCLFLLPGQSIPPDQGVAVFWAVPPFVDYQSLGTMSAGSYSAFFRTGWPTMSALEGCPVIRLGISLETADTTSNLASAMTHEQYDKLGWASLIARNLAEHLGSFAYPTPAGDRLMVPPDAVDRWLERFESKFRRDPDFLLRPHD